jgi:hypothetical protein
MSRALRVRILAAVALALPLLATVRFVPHAPASGALRAPVKGPRKCLSEDARDARPRAPRAELRSADRAPLLVAADPVLRLAPPADATDPARDWAREPRPLRCWLARASSHSTLAPPAA